MKRDDELYIVVAESDLNGDMYYFKCDHDPKEVEFECFVRDEFPDHWKKDERFDDDDDDWDEDEDDWEDDYDEGDGDDDWEDLGGTAMMTIIDVVYVENPKAKTFKYEDTTLKLADLKTIEGYDW